MTYDNKCDEYPEKKFDTARQIGWIADDMALVLPEVVSEDLQGYKQIAYSRVGPVLGQAIKELKQESDKRYDEVSDKISREREDLMSLRKSVAEMQSTMKHLADENIKLNTMLNDLVRRLGNGDNR